MVVVILLTRKDTDDSPKVGKDHAARSSKEHPFGLDSESDLDPVVQKDANDLKAVDQEEEVVVGLDIV